MLYNYHVGTHSIMLLSLWNTVRKITVLYMAIIHTTYRVREVGSLLPTLWSYRCWHKHVGRNYVRYVCTVCDTFWYYTITKCTSTIFITRWTRYLNHHVNCRCDDLIKVLLKIEEDTFHNRMQKEVMMRPQDASIKQEGCDWRYRGKDINDSAVTITIIAIWQNFWGETFTVI